MIKIKNGDTLHQWDIDRELEIAGIEYDELHWSNVVTTEALKTTAPFVPNELLQVAIPVTVYASKNDKVVETAIFEVEDRAKPADYVLVTTGELESIIDESGVLEYDFN